MKKQKLAKVSPWLLAAACALLTLIIAVFAVNNYHREKNLMSESLVQQGLTIIRFVKSSTRASLRGNLMNIRMAMWQWTDHVQQAINNTTDQPGINFLGLIDEEGTILASSSFDKNNQKIDKFTFTFIQSIDDGNDSSNSYRIKESMRSSGPVFQIAGLYYPFGPRNYSPRMGGPGFMSRLPPNEIKKLRGRDRHESFAKMQELSSKKFVLLVELDLSEFNKAVKRQKLQIFSLSVVLLLVGIGGWLSLLTLQGLKGSQSRLRQIREFTDILISSLPIGLIATGDDGNIRIFNQSAEEMVGITAAKVLGRKPEHVLPKELAGELTKQIITNGTIEQYEVNVIDRYNRSRSLMLVGLPVVDSDKKFAGNTLLIQDVSQIKHLQQEVRRNERLAALGKMAAGVAHELRNPLSSIKGLALLLKSKLTKDAQGADTADILVQEVERLNRSIGELLDYARPHKLQLEEINLSDVIEKSVVLVKADLDSANIKLHIEGREKSSVLADKDKLNQVFLNLLLNSIQAMDNGGNITITSYQEGSRVVCRIDDTGCGVEDSLVTKVFDPYFTTKNEGTGLGLALSSKIIEEHSGTIEFYSAVGKGTSVKLILPVYGDES